MKEDNQTRKEKKLDYNKNESECKQKNEIAKYNEQI